MEQSIIKKTVHSLKGRSIFLIGMMGSGKSQTGLKLAELLKYKYIDLDSLIEKLAKKSINQIFNDEGENKKLKINKKKDSVNNLLLDFLLNFNFFLKIYLSDLIFKFGMFKSAIHIRSKNKFELL